MKMGTGKVRTATLVIVLVAVAAVSETRREFRYPVKTKASVSITNEYGPISVKPSSGSQVVVFAVVHSDKVEVDQVQSGNRVDVTSHLLAGADQKSGQVDYEVQVPPDASVTLRSTTGPLQAEKLHGALNLQGVAASIEVRDVRSAHVHVRTMNGPAAPTNIHDGHVEITSVSGDVTMNSVSGPLVQVSSTSGKISYEGDFGSGGEYSFTSHSGDILATAPSYASIDVTARSATGPVENDFQLQPKHTPFVLKAGSAFAGTMGKAASSVKLFSTSGKIHLKQR